MNAKLVVVFPALGQLLGDTQSPSFLTASLDRLAKACPHFRRRKREGLGHGGSESSEWGVDPNRVAPELKRYFSAAARVTALTNN